MTGHLVGLPCILRMPQDPAVWLVRSLGLGTGVCAGQRCMWKNNSTGSVLGQELRERGPRGKAGWGGGGVPCARKGYEAELSGWCGYSWNTGGPGAAW